MIRLYTAPTPNGVKVSIALEELGLDYEVQRVNTAGGEQFQDWFLKLNPNHKVPVIDDDGLVIWESGAILLYLAEKYGDGKLLPRDPAARIHAIQYAFFQTGGIGPNLGRLSAALRKEGEKNAEMIEIFSKEVERLLGVIDRILSDGREYMVGEYTIADIMHFGWMRYLLALETPQLMALPRVVGWLERIAKRPAVQRGLEVPAD